MNETPQQRFSRMKRAAWTEYKRAEKQASEQYKIDMARAAEDYRRSKRDCSPVESEKVAEVSQ